MAIRNAIAAGVVWGSLRSDGIRDTFQAAINFVQQTKLLISSPVRPPIPNTIGGRKRPSFPDTSFGRLAKSTIRGR